MSRFSKLASMLGALALIGLTGCERAGSTLVVADTGSPESVILAEAVRQSARGSGLSVAPRLGFEGPDAAAAGMAEGQANLLVAAEGSIDGLTAIARLAPQPQPVAVMLAARADTLGVSQLRDLTAQASGLRLGGWYAAPLPDALAPLAGDVHMAAPDMRSDLIADLRAGRLDAALALDTDAALTAGDLLVLEPQAQGQPMMAVLAAEASPDATVNAALARLDGAFTAADLRGMQAEVDAGEDVRRVVARALASRDIDTGFENISPTLSVALLNLFLMVVLGWIGWLFIRTAQQGGTEGV